jgi:hypothetical protein
MKDHKAHKYEIGKKYWLVYERSERVQSRDPFDNLKFQSPPVICGNATVVAKRSVCLKDLPLTHLQYDIKQWGYELSDRRDYAYLKRMKPNQAVSVIIFSKHPTTKLVSENFLVDRPIVYDKQVQECVFAH